MKKPQTTETLTTCTATQRKIKYAYPPDQPVPYARVVVASSVTNVEVSTLSTGLQPTEAQQLTIQHALRALDLLN
jgi:hypothetical protein